MKTTKPLAIVAAIFAMSFLAVQPVRAESPDVENEAKASQANSNRKLSKQKENTPRVGGGLGRDLIRRAAPEKAQAADKPHYGPVLKVKPQGMQPAAGKQKIKNQPQKRATSFGVLLDGKSGDDSDKNASKPNNTFGVKPPALQGIEPDEIDVK